MEIFFGAEKTIFGHKKSKLLCLHSGWRKKYRRRFPAHIIQEISVFLKSPEQVFYISLLSVMSRPSPKHWSSVCVYKFVTFVWKVAKKIVHDYSILSVLDWRDVDICVICIGLSIVKVIRKCESILRYFIWEASKKIIAIFHRIEDLSTNCISNVVTGICINVRKVFEKKN